MPCHSRVHLQDRSHQYVFITNHINDLPSIPLNTKKRRWTKGVAGESTLFLYTQRYRVPLDAFRLRIGSTLTLNGGLGPSVRQTIIDHVFELPRIFHRTTLCALAKQTRSHCVTHTARVSDKTLPLKRRRKTIPRRHITV